MSLGFRVLPRTWNNDFPFMAMFHEIPVANVSDVLFRMNGTGPNIRPQHAGAKLIGRALTVRSSPGDNLLVYKALSMCKPGDVIVVDAGGDLTNAIVGDLLVTYAIERQAAGMVINGAVRDIDTLRNSNFPVFAAGISHRGPYKNGPGEINASVAIGGMVVNAGDLILGDQDGVIAFPYQDAEEILLASQERFALEERMREEIKSGRYDTSWVDAELRRLGCELPR